MATIGQLDSSEDIGVGRVTHESHVTNSISNNLCQLQYFQPCLGNSLSVTENICGRGQHYTVNFSSVTSLWELCGGFVAAIYPRQDNVSNFEVVT